MADQIMTPTALSERSDLKLSRHPAVQDVNQFIVDRTVGLVRTEDDQYIGTGTLVSVDDKRCILTAAHVIDEFESTDALGVAMPSPVALEVHRLEVHCDYVQRAYAESIGTETPDIGIFILRGNYASIISSKKSFYNLNVQKQEILDSPPDCDSPIWVLAGTPDAWSRTGGPERTFGSTREFTLLLGFGAVELSSRRCDFKCFDFMVDGPEDSGIPKSFGGCSGGGLWYVPIPTSKGIAVGKPRLMGVASEQARTGSCKNTILCVGSEVIYKHMIDIVRKQCMISR